MAAFKLELLELPEGYRTYLVRVDPSDPDLRDADGDPDMAFWLVDMIAYDRTVLSLPALWRQMVVQTGHRLSETRCDSVGHAKALAEAYLLWVLRHPQTPWGLGLRHKDARTTRDFSMEVIFRGVRHRRDRRGVLTRIPGAQRVPGMHQTPDEFARTYRATLALLVELGLEADRS